MSFILVLGALASIVYAGFLFNSIVGFIVLGIALGFLGWILSPTEGGTS